MSEAALLAVPAPFEFAGHHYLVAYRDLECETQFALWCAAEAALDLWRLKARVPADFYAEQMRLYNAKLCGKGFRWGGEEVHAISWIEPGQKQLLWLKIMRGAEKGGETILRETVDEIAKDADKWQELLFVLWRQDYPDFFVSVSHEMNLAPPPAPSPSQPGNQPSAPTILPATDSTPKTP